ncbi:Uncharacterised protein [Mycobacteroides abscessus subsp. abscessus]|nr:Uncharacterised protein [Mycobacteroides abscessus subsp. abscessus]
MEYRPDSAAPAIQVASVIMCTSAVPRPVRFSVSTRGLRSASNSFSSTWRLAGF